MLRVLDSFGTEPEFNHAHYAQSKGHKTPWGKWNLNPQQFNTMFRKSAGCRTSKLWLKKQSVWLNHGPCAGFENGLCNENQRREVNSSRMLLWAVANNASSLRDSQISPPHKVSHSVV